MLKRITSYAAMVALFAWSPANAAVELRMMWYSDGNEGEVMRSLLDRFEQANPDISVVLDEVAYKQLVEGLPVQLAAGEGPDVTRVTDLGGLAKYYLDMRPYLSDAAYWETNFGPFLSWLRVPGDTESIHGFMSQLTVTGPYINKTLFEQAGVPIPKKGATWEDWAKAATEVADKLDIPIPIAMDRSGHRVAGPAISQGAKYFDADGEPAVVDEGFKRMAQLLYDWHQNGTMTKELWGSVSGSAYKGANDEFKNSQVVLYMSGSWQISQFNEQIGDDFDWWAIDSPCGPSACTGMPGGAAITAIKDTEHPAEVAKLMEWLAQEEVLAEFYGRSLFIPGHLGLSAKGIEFDTDNRLAKHALEVFAAHVGDIDAAAFQLQAYPYNRLMFNASISRVNQAIMGELTLDEAYERIESDVEKDLTEKRRSN